MVSFQVGDYVVGAIVLMVPMAIGIIFAIRDKDKATREEYLMGGRQMSLLPVTMSLFVTFASAITLIGIPADIYSYGSGYIVLGVGLGLAYLACVNTLVPLVYPLRLTSMYEYLQLRYESNAVRQLSACLGLFQTTCYMAVALLSPALALETSAGIPFWVSVALVGSIGTLYTTLGGIKSVIWTDAFQTVILFLGIGAIIIKGVVSVGGVEEVWRLSEEGGRTTMNSFFPDPRIRHTFYGCTIGMAFLWLVNCFNQSSIQRVCSMKTMRDAKISFFLNGPILFFYTFVLAVFGNIAYAFFSKTKCDPYEAGMVKNKNQLAPYFVLETMTDLPGMAGLYVSTLCCGSLSTLSSGINALATNTIEDILGHNLRNVKESKVTLFIKFLVLLYGSVIIALAYGAKYLDGPVTQITGSVFGALGSPVLGIFIAGASIPWVNKYGALVGVLCAITFNLWVSICNRLYGVKTPSLPPTSIENCFTNSSASFNFTEIADVSLSDQLNNTDLLNLNISSSVPDTANINYGFFLYDVSYEWYSFMGVTVCITVALIVSYATKSVRGISTSTDPKLMFPFLRPLWGMEKDPKFVATTSDVELRGDGIDPSEVTKTKRI